MMTTIKERLKTDLTVFLKSGDELGKSTLRGVLGAIQTAEKSGKQAVEFNDTQVVEILSREAKKRRETAQVYADAGHPDRAAKETAEAELIGRYLPAQLTEEAITELVEAAVSELGDNANLGQVMKLVTPLTKGRADGKLVSEIVRKRLG